MDTLRQAPHDRRGAGHGRRRRRFWTWPTSGRPPTGGTGCFELADDLFASIKMQTSVPKYKAISVDRGATLDTGRRAAEQPAVAQGAVRRPARHVGRSRAAQAASTKSSTGRIPAPADFTTTWARSAGSRTWSWVPASRRTRRSWFRRTPVLPASARCAMSWKDHAESMLDAPLRNALRRARSAGAVQDARRLLRRRAEEKDSLRGQRARSKFIR